MAQFRSMSLDELALVFKTLSRVGAPDVDPKIIPFHYESTLRINKMRPLMKMFSEKISTRDICLLQTSL